MTTVYEKLCAIAQENAGNGYLRAYVNDLHVHDKRSLESAPFDSEFVWLLRDCGTQFFPVAAGMDPVWLTFWLKPGNCAIPPLAFHIRRGVVRPISHGLAVRLANEPNPQGKRIIVSLFRKVA